MFARSPPRFTERNVYGTFETAPFDTAGSITGWTIGGGGKVQAKVEGSTSSNHSAALDANSDSQGNTLSQTFVTNVLEFYTVEFVAVFRNFRDAGI